jgi:hypothetical protein
MFFNQSNKKFYLIDLMITYVCYFFVFRCLVLWGLVFRGFVFWGLVFWGLIFRSLVLWGLVFRSLVLWGFVFSSLVGIGSSDGEESNKDEELKFKKEIVF